MIERRVGNHTCSATVCYREPRKGKPYYMAICTCGWLGVAQRSAGKATAEARSHTDTVTIRLDASEEDQALLAW